MKYYKCHCGFEKKLHQLRAGKLGLLGGFLMVAHLLFHVAECLVLPAFLMAINGETVEALDLDSHELHLVTIDVDLTTTKLMSTDLYVGSNRIYRPSQL